MEKFEILKNEKRPLLESETCLKLIKEFRQKKEQTEERPKGEKLKFNGSLEKKDVYNITAPFKEDKDEDDDDDDEEEVDYLLGEIGPKGFRNKNNEATFVLGRTELRGNEESQVMVFKEEDGIWMRDKRKPVFEMQDPFFMKIGDETVIGGVETFYNSNSKKSGKLKWRTIFYKSKSLETIDKGKFAEGPIGMKDIRLVELQDGKIAVFTRPSGKLGFTVIDSLNELTKENIEKAEIIEGLFAGKEWGSANELHLLKNGKIGVLGHIASLDEEKKKHYYPIVFSFDLASKQISGMKIIATAEDFGDGEAKREDLKDVMFPGGLRKEGEKIMLYAGIKDVEAGRIEVADSWEDLFDSEVVSNL